VTLYRSDQRADSGFGPDIGLDDVAERIFGLRSVAFGLDHLVTSVRIGRFQMAELKTGQTDASVDAFLDAIVDEARRKDCKAVLQLMREATRSEPRMWGSNMVGFGSYHYKYASGREGDWFLTGFAPRKRDLTIYVMAGFDKYEALLGKLGKFRTGKSCLYVKQLSDIDVEVLRQLIVASLKYMRQQYGP
jgi:hypothetical protein